MNKEITIDEEVNYNLIKNLEILEKQYLETNNYEIISTPDEKVNLADIRFFEFQKIVYEKDIKIKDKLSSVFSALHNQEATIIFKLVSDGTTCKLYIGLLKTDHLAETTKILKHAIEGNLPGTTFSTNKDTGLARKEIETLNQKLERAKEITVVNGIPSLKNKEDEHFIQGIENLVLGMQNKEFTALFLATPINNEEIQEAKEVYEKVYSELSPHAEKILNLTQSESESLTKGTTESIGSTFSVTKGTSETISKNRQLGIGSTIRNKIFGTKNNEVEKRYNSDEETRSKVDENLRKASKSILFPAKSLYHLGKDADTREKVFNDKFRRDTPTNKQKTSTSSETSGETKNSSDTENHSISESNSKSIQTTVKNKTVENKLEQLELQLERLKLGESLGLWNTNVFFISEEAQHSAIAANIYAGIIKGEDTRTEKAKVVTYNETNKEFSSLKSYARKYESPLIRVANTEHYNILSNCINTQELTIQMGLPTKSFPGVDVVEIVPFGNNLVIEEGAKNIEVGKVFNYDKITENPFVLDIEKFTGHVFVTGSTGSGKSNVTYNLLSSLKSKGIKFMVVEPAKGEYKDEFGGLKDVSVYGTNPRYTEVLKVNPFSFPEQIHVYEHIDRLIEILNACWVMEAAMPAMLKDAVEKCYIKLGWNLDTSTNITGTRVFPTFETLASILPELIENSAYSQEIKSNYQGALTTRVNSMNNGLLKLIFSIDEIESSKLFDENVIVDLSRVPSAETKSLLMGILFMKLQEHRISSEVENNSQLKHVTVIEEAHNLLKRTSAEQSQGSANLQGKSVEMISNAIAEMRTYGEGFILADQAPGLLDPSAIRNTNTKICLRLPSQEDRELVGKSMNLIDEQVNQLAKLRTGVAAVYQNNWEEAILCKFSLYDEGGNSLKKSKSILNNRTTGKIVTELMFALEGKEYDKKLLQTACLEPNYRKHLNYLAKGLFSESIIKAAISGILSIDEIHDYLKVNNYKNNDAEKHFKKILENYYLTLENIDKITQKFLNKTEIFTNLKKLEENGITRNI